MVTLADLKPGDVLTYWHDNGIGGELGYVTVVRVNRVTVTVRAESGHVSRQRPEVFTRRLNLGEWHPWKGE